MTTSWLMRDYSPNRRGDDDEDVAASCVERQKLTGELADALAVPKERHRRRAPGVPQSDRRACQRAAAGDNDCFVNF